MLFLPFEYWEYPSIFFLTAIFYSSVFFTTSTTRVLRLIGSDGKESACSAEDLGLIPGLGSSPGGGHGNPLQYSCLENPHGQRCLVGYSPWGHKELDMTETLSTHMVSELRPFPPLYPPCSGRWRVYSRLIQLRKQDSIFSKFPIRELFFPGGARYHHFSSSPP